MSDTAVVTEVIPIIKAAGTEFETPVDLVSLRWDKKLYVWETAQGGLPGQPAGEHHPSGKPRSEHYCCPSACSV